MTTVRILASLWIPISIGWLGPAPAQPKPSVPTADVVADEVADDEAPDETSEPGAEPESSDGDAGDGPEPDAAVAPEQVADVILPCGVRVIAARDASLPVAAVVLAIEVGTRDDPDKLPGLVHALAYHLQQGNRELAPGEAIATAHDVGGLAGMAVGPAQVRFESLVPVSQLDAMLRVEALRLRAPNTGRELWLKSLSYARNDDAIKLVVPREVAAAAWADAGLEHDGRKVGQALGDMLDQALGAQLARLFDYRSATLVVVGPDDPQALVARVEPLFADLPARPRKAIAAARPPKPSGAGPRVVRVARQNGDAMVWAVPGTPRGRAWAQVLCGTINRQKRAADEPPKARLRCTFTDDPRRPMLVVRAIGFDPTLGPEPMIAARLARIAEADAEPELAALLEDQRARIEADLAFDLRGPLELATYLASATERSGPQTAGPLRARDQALGMPVLTSNPTVATELAAAIPELLDTRTAVLVLGPDQDPPPPVHDAAGPDGSGDAASPDAPDPDPSKPEQPEQPATKEDS